MIDCDLTRTFCCFVDWLFFHFVYSQFTGRATNETITFLNESKKLSQRCLLPKPYIVLRFYEMGPNSITIDKKSSHWLIWWPQPLLSSLVVKCMYLLINVCCVIMIKGLSGARSIPRSRRGRKRVAPQGVWCRQPTLMVEVLVVDSTAQTHDL